MSFNFIRKNKILAKISEFNSISYLIGSCHLRERLVLSSYEKSLEIVPVLFITSLHGKCIRKLLDELRIFPLKYCKNATKESKY